MRKIDIPHSETESTDVLIIGGGPVGLLSSYLLSRQGVRNILVEKRKAVGTHPRARGISCHASEHLRQAGLESVFRAINLPREWGQAFEYCHTLSNPLMSTPARSSIHPKTGKESDYDWATPAIFILSSQEKIDKAIHAAAAELAGVGNIRLSNALLGYDITPHGVRATLHDMAGDREYQVDARWLLGCDGNDSLVRSTEHISRIGGIDHQAYLNVQIRAGLTRFVGPERRASIHSIIGAQQGTICTIDGDRRWQVQVAYDDKQDPLENWTHDRVRERIRSMVGPGGEDLEIEVLSVTPWTVNAFAAENFLKGPIFLLGDAAHVVPPTGGFGLNTGIEDAFNLAWKIRAVHEGWGGQALLQSYETERRHAAMTRIEAIKNNVRRIGRLRQATSDEERRTIIGGSSLGRQLGLDLGIHYPAGALVRDESGANGETSSSDERYVPCAWPGHRAPHVWLRGKQGLVSTIDLFDRAFVLLAGDQGQAWVAAAARIPGHEAVPVEAYRIGRDADLQAVHGDFEEAYSITPAGLVLVRPDGYVAYRSAAAVDDPVAELRRVFDRILGVNQYSRHPH